MKNNLYKTFYLLVLFLALAACKKGGDDQAPAPEVTNSAVTIDNYNKITTGMTYTQVVTVLGQGTLGSTNNYSWSADDTKSIVIYVTFSNNVVVSKSQIGLASSGSGGTSGGTTGGTTSGGCPATYNGHTVFTGPRGGCYYINSKGNKTYI
jgi:hypothetical protein